MFGDKQNFVGQYYQQVGHALLGGELCLNQNGDICLWKEGLTIEIKSSGFSSSYGFRLHDEQIEEYERMTCFPFDRAWYMFFSYRNKNLMCEDGKKHSELARHENALEVNQYLAETTMWCTIVDLSIISRWKESRPLSTKSIIGHYGRKTVDIKCREVHGLSNGSFDSTLRGLELDSSKYGILTSRVALVVEPDLLGKYHMKFNVNAILPREELRTAKRIFRKRGIRLKEVGPKIPADL